MIQESDFAEILASMDDYFKRKNHDYGNSFERTADEFGLVAPLIRIHDKVNRLTTLVKNQNSAKTNEKIEDTLLDLANYSVLTLAYLRSNASN